MNCPSCKAPLAPAGELDIDGQTLAVYQCDACVRDWRFDGEVFEAALTFAVDEAGRFFDPETCEPLDASGFRPSDN
jgi:hypothetical protein